MIERRLEPVMQSIPEIGMPVGEVVFPHLDLYSALPIDGNIAKYLDPEGLIIFELVTVLDGDVDLVLDGFEELSGFKIDC